MSVSIKREIMASRGLVTHDEAHRAVDELVTLLEQRFQFSDGSRINEIIKAGSLGHGTPVFGDFDVDLVIYSNGVKTDVIERSGFRHYLVQLDTFLKENLGPGSYVQTEKDKQALTRWRSVQFSYKGKVDVDLLVSPNWKDQFQFYQFLKTTANPSKYTVFAAKWQVQFFKHRPPEVKEYIRKAKAWRNKMWPVETGGAGKPSSYLISLLVLKAYETGGSSRINETLKTIVQGSPDIYWEEYYQRRNYPQMIPSRPRIIDPANPANNVWISGFKTFQPNEKIYDYEPGDGNAYPLRQKIHTIDLSQQDGTARQQSRLYY